MSNANPNRVGLRQGGSDDWELFRDVFAGEVLTAFETMVKLRDKHRIRTIDHGKSASFPAIHKASAQRHTPGTELLGNKIPHQDVVVTIDDALVSDVFIANVDEAMNHFDVRGPYSTEMGRALAYEYDRNVARSILNAARGGALFNGDQGGSTLVNAAYETNGSTLLSGIGLARQKLDEKDVPVDTSEVFAGLLPAQYYLVAATDEALNRDYGGDGSAAKEELRTRWGVRIIKSNAFPFGLDETAYDGTSNPDGLVGAPDGTANALPADHPQKYQGDWTNTVGKVWTEAAAATVQLRDLSLEDEYQLGKRGTLMVGSYLVGHGTLRNKCAVELAKA